MGRKRRAEDIRPSDYLHRITKVGAVAGALFSLASFIGWQYNSTRADNNPYSVDSQTYRQEISMAEKDRERLEKLDQILSEQDYHSEARAAIGPLVEAREHIKVGLKSANERIVLNKRQESVRKYEQWEDARIGRVENYQKSAAGGLLSVLFFIGVDLFGSFALAGRNHPIR